MSMLKKILRKFLGRKNVRLCLLVVHIPIAWVIIRTLNLFDTEWYRMQDCKSRMTWLHSSTPLLHYLAIGRRKGLTPSPFFVGEYYDSRRWNISIIDPLLKYILHRKTWPSATSPLFDGSIYPDRSRFTPPLYGYMKELRNDTDAVFIYHDRRIRNGAKIKWINIKDSIYKEVQERTAQQKMWREAEPVAHFNKSKESALIEESRVFNFSKNDLVSIVMPAWNRESLIKEAIDSVRSQSYENWELIIVDDGSTDNTVQVAKNYASKDPRIRVYTPPHGGVSRARNYAIEQAKGEWVAFLDSDNTWTSHFLQSSVMILKKRKKAASYSAIKMNNNGRVRYRVSGPNVALLETGNFIDLNALIVKKNVLDSIGYFDERLRRMVDYDLVCRISKVTNFVYVPVIGVNYTDHDDLVRISTTESVNWDGVVKSKNFIDWDNEAKRKNKEVTSILIPVTTTFSNGIEMMARILNSIGENTEVVIVDASSNSATNIVMAALQAVDGRVRYYREPAARDVVLAANYGFVKCKGDKIILVNQHILVEPNWFNPIIKELNKTPVCGPLQLQPNRTIRSAGVEYYGDKVIPVDILANHPLSDVTRLDVSYEVNSLRSGCVGVRAGLFAQMHGFNPLYAGGFEVQDFCNRAKQLAKKTKIKLIKQSIVINPDEGRGWYSPSQKQFIQDWAGKVGAGTSQLWSKAGFRVLGYDRTYPDIGNMSAVSPRLENKIKKGVYRWAIKISAPSDERRHAWGDVYYAEALSRALVKLGQSVAIDYRESHYRPTAYLDDINVDLRGLDNFIPQQGKVNILWVISHPEKVTQEIISAFDKVYAAGSIWAEMMTNTTGLKINTLLQCTDPDVFHPIDQRKNYRSGVLFVGNSRRVLRPVVRDAIKAGVDISVYGAGWEGLIDSQYIKDTFIPNDKLAEAYGSAEIVLNDHWEDMRQWGFISNRLFDIAATGTPIISDRVQNLEKVFAGLVRGYDSPEDIKKIVADKDNHYPNKQERLAIAERIRKDHSFDARAKELLEDVTSMMKTDV